MNLVNKLALLTAIVLLQGCGNSTLKNAARTLNRDLDLVKSPYQYTIAKDEERLIRVLRRMPVGETAADSTLRADIEKTIAQKLQSTPSITEVRIFETEPNFRREIWVVEKEAERLAFDVHMRPGRNGVDLSVEGPVIIEGTL